MAVAFATMLFLGLATAEEKKTDDKTNKDTRYVQLTGVHNLTRSTLDDVREGDWVLVIVAQWCGFSRNLVSKLSAVAYNLKDAKVAVIDGEEDPSIHIQFSLDSYPFVCYVHNGAIHVYDGIPEWDLVLKWATDGWKNVKPLEGPSNPFGWQMTLIGASTHFFWRVYEVVSNVAARINVSPLPAFGIIFGFVAVTSLITITCCVARYEDEIVLPLSPSTVKPKAQKSEKAKPKDSKPQEKPKEKEKPKESEPQKKSEEKKEKPEESKTSTVRQRKGKKGAAKRLD